MSESCNNDCSNCTCSGECDSNNQKTNNENKKVDDLKEKPNKDSKIKKVIAIIGGKGGVGKSLITSMLAVTAKNKGYKVSLLDADITGPSIPKTFGVYGKAIGNEQGILPMVSKSGINIMSINCLLDNESDPVVWRGPMLGNVVKQFWSDVVWGEVDYMFVDMPPGTGDVPLTVFQSLPIDGIVVVASPQELVSMIVEKAVNMAKMMNISILGVVENMAYFDCPDCNERHYIYGKSNIEDVAKRHNINKIIKLPIDMQLAKLCDEGKIENISADYMEELGKIID